MPLKTTLTKPDSADADSSGQPGHWLKTPWESMKWVDVRYGGVTFLIGSYRQTPEPPQQCSPEQSAVQASGRQQLGCCLENKSARGDGANRAD